MIDAPIGHTYRQSLMISVGLASYNRPDLLRRAIQSVLSQTYTNLEILISDNASSNPKVREVIEEFSRADVRIRCFFHPENQGAFFNFSSLLNEARGKYFIWLADDDYWGCEFVENLISRSVKSGAALTYGRAEIVDVDVPAQDRFGKEMETSIGRFSSIVNFLRFDTDSVFYGVFPTAVGKRLVCLLRNWWVPRFVSAEYPFLEYNFVSYVFIFGLLSSGGFCNASSEKAVHYVGGRSDFSPSPSIGWRHIILFFVYVVIHIQMAIRFVVAAFLVGSLTGLLFAPVGAAYLFFRRIKMIANQRLNKLLKGFL